jgi:hypothetical protein
MSLDLLSIIAQFDKSAETDPNKWWLNPEFQAGNQRMKDKGMIPTINDFTDETGSPMEDDPMSEAEMGAPTILEGRPEGR